MDDQNQNNTDWPAGFLIKDKSGQFRKVQDGEIIDVRLKPQTPPAPPRVTPPAPIPAPPAVPRPVMSPKPPVSSSDKAVLFLAPEDEAEIKEHAADLEKKLGETAPADYETTLQQAVQKIIQQNNLQFDSEILLKRFSKVLESKLRNVRDSIETEEVLTRPIKIGGLNLPLDTAKKVIGSAEAVASTLHQPEAEKQIATEETKEIIAEAGIFPPAAREMFAPPPPAFVPRPQPRPMSPPPPVAMPTVEEKPEQLAAEIKKELEAVQAKEKKVAVEPARPIREQPVPPPTAEVSTADELYRQPTADVPRMSQVRPSMTERPQMVDIKQVSKVIGPVEELQEIDLKEFRRHGTNPEEAAAAILEKVDLLAEESWQFKMDGMAAWKKSETYQLYLAIGQESIESTTSVADVIRRRLQEGKPYLLLEEFLAINSLNNKITQ